MKSLNGLIMVAASILFFTVTSADPVPYPDIGSGDGAKGVKKVDIKDSSSSTSTGDSGTTKGVVSSKSKGSSFVSPGSIDVKVEGKPVR